MKHDLETLRKEMTIGTKESAMDELNELEKELREIEREHECRDCEYPEDHVCTLLAQMLGAV